VKLLLVVLLPLSLLACKDNDTQSKVNNAIASAMAAASGRPPLRDAGPGGDPMVVGARERFEKSWSCPEDRVVAKVRTDLDPLQFHPAKVKTPPEEVRDDPARYAKWNADQEAERQTQRAAYAGHKLVELDGCGHTEIQDCRPHHAHGAVYPDWADCEVLKPPK
jgi:hypothetical protein